MPAHPDLSTPNPSLVDRGERSGSGARVRPGPLPDRAHPVRLIARPTARLIARLISRPTARMMVLLTVLALLAGATGCSSPGATPSSYGADGSTVPVAARGSAPSPPPAAPLPRYAGYSSLTHDDPSHWVCRPGRTDICQQNLDTTIVAADGTLTVEPFHPAADPPVDCFYLYPTISRDEGAYSDWSASDDEEGWVTLNQAARLRSVCRVFAPVYRQMTLKSLVGRLNGGDAAAGAAVDPYADVADAFRTYMAEDNGGRGFVLIGHSQGSAMLQRLIAEEIDPNDDVRALLVSAVLAGWPLVVPAGGDVGGTFQNVPLCRAPDQIRCAYAWSSFRATAPPTPAAFFGRPRSGEGMAACNTPRTISDGARADLHAYFPANRRATILSGAPVSGPEDAWVDPASGSVSTPFVSVPGLLTGTCTTSDGFHYLSVTIAGDAGDPRADDISGDLTPEWGLHLADINLVMGDLIDAIRRQAEVHLTGS